MFKYFCFMIYAVFILACGSGEKKESAKEGLDITPPPNFQDSKVIQLTTQGANSEASFSPDGKFIIYQSRNRVDHQNSQIYEMEISSKSEKRVTHHDGESSNPVYHPSGNRIYYASTTDEIKERPDFIQQQLEQMSKAKGKMENHAKVSYKLRPYEIYSSLRDGSSIQRITESEGFDGEPSVHPLGKKLVYTSTRYGGLSVLANNKTGTSPRKLVSNGKINSEPAISPDGKMLAWVEYADDFSNSVIYIGDRRGRKARSVTTAKALYSSVCWHPDNNWIVFSSNRNKNKNFELYLVDPKGLCLKRLTYHPAKDSLPCFNPNGDKIVFNSNRKGGEQIFLMDFVPPEACLQELP